MPGARTDPASAWNIPSQPLTGAGKTLRSWKGSKVRGHLEGLNPSPD